MSPNDSSLIVNSLVSTKGEVGMKICECLILLLPADWLGEVIPVSLLGHIFIKKKVIGKITKM